MSLSGKSPVFPDKVGRKVFSVLHNRYGLKVIGFVEWSIDGPTLLCPRNWHFGGQTGVSAQLCPRNWHFGGQTVVPTQLCPLVFSLIERHAVKRHVDSKSALWWTNHDFNTTLSTKLAFWWTSHDSSTTLSTKSAFWWTNMILAQM